ncbi:MAG: hypothetical protein KBB88_00785 [Candidatus Pacebacteria bacterium]|nr:hypothetical protein [Candidatus Paceibacterota bacterium]
MNELKIFGLILLGLFVVWVFLGGKERYEADPSQQGVFIEPLAPVGTGATYGPSNSSSGFTPPSTWLPVETEKFSVYLPYGWKFEELQGVDSYVGRFTNGITTFTFDYGRYSTHIIREGDERYTTIYETIDRKNAELVRPKTTTGTITGVYIDHGDEDLTITGNSLSTANQDLLFNIARTVDFSN